MGALCDKHQRMIGGLQEVEARGSGVETKKENVEKNKLFYLSLFFVVLSCYLVFLSLLFVCFLVRCCFFVSFRFFVSFILPHLYGLKNNAMLMTLTHAACKRNMSTLYDADDANNHATGNNSRSCGVQASCAQAVLRSSCE